MLFFGVLFAMQALGGAAISAVRGITIEAYGLGAPYGMMAMMSIPWFSWLSPSVGRRLADSRSIRVN